MKPALVAVPMHVSEDAILAYVEGRATDREGVERHLDGCDECRQLVAELARTSLVEGDEPWGGDGTPTAPRGQLPTPGTRLAGRFRIVRALGHGAMGMVYEAEDEALGVNVAIKVFWPTLARDPRVIESIRREAALGRRIQHPNVRRVFDVEESDGITFLTMELVDGETLEARLRAGPIGEAEAIRILQQVCDALGAAHAEGIVHRDLKPGNIALDGRGRVIVMDFGLARDVNADASQKQGRGLVGTPAYWSPEQARGEAATPSSDLYSLGLIAYRLLTGESYTIGGASRLVGPYAAVVDRCLELRPGRRFSSAESARRAFESARGSRDRRIAASVVIAGVLMSALAVGVGVRLLSMRTESAAARVDARAAAAPPSSIEREPLAPATSIAITSASALPSSVPVEALPATSTHRSRAKALRPPLEPLTAIAPAESPATPEAVGVPHKPQGDAPRKPKRPIDREDPYQ